MTGLSESDKNSVRTEYRKSPGVASQLYYRARIATVARNRPGVCQFGDGQLATADPP